MSIEPHIWLLTLHPEQGLQGSINMKLINKTKGLFLNNSGETMVEVIVAFTLLSIMLVVFAQGLAWATKTEVNATTSRETADQAMGKLCSTLAGHPTIGVTKSDEILGGPYSVGNGTINCYEYTVVVNGERMTYRVFEPVLTPTPAGG